MRNMEKIKENFNILTNKRREEEIKINYNVKELELIQKEKAQLENRYRKIFKQNEKNKNLILSYENNSNLNNSNESIFGPSSSLVESYDQKILTLESLIKREDGIKHEWINKYNNEHKELIRLQNEKHKLLSELQEFKINKSSYESDYNSLNLTSISKRLEFSTQT